MARDRNAKLRNLIAGYSDSIRLSDYKSNIAVLFVAIMMGTVLQFRNLYPWYLNLPVVMAPFMIIFISLLFSVYPRFPRSGRHRFPIRRRPQPQDFEFVQDAESDLETLPERCAMFSRILWWKTVSLQIAYATAMLSLAAAAILLFIAHL